MINMILSILVIVFFIWLVEYSERMKKRIRLEGRNKKGEFIKKNKIEKIVIIKKEKRKVLVNDFMNGSYYIEL